MFNYVFKILFFFRFTLEVIGHLDKSTKLFKDTEILTEKMIFLTDDFHLKSTRFGLVFFLSNFFLSDKSIVVFVLFFSFFKLSKNLLKL